MNFKTEIARKVMHLLSCIIGILIFILDRSIYIPILFTLTLLVVSFDIARIKFSMVQNIYNNFFSIFTRKSEKKQITGASFLFIGSSIVAFLFDKEIVFQGLLVMSFSDSCAALIGITFGKTKLFNKTLEGSMAFFLTTFTILFFFNFNLLEIFIISLIATITELFSTYRYNDNILVPLLTCSTIYLLKII